MTTYYVDSNSASEASPYDTWAKAAHDIATIAALDVAGDIIYIASSHSQTNTSSQTYAWAGTAAAPIKVICGTTAAAPPTTSAQTAVIAVTGSTVNTTVASAGSTYWQGVIFQGGDGANRSNMFLCATNGEQFYENCQFQILGTHVNAGIDALTVNGGRVTLKNCVMKFAATGQNFTTSASYSSCIINGGGIDATSSAITLWNDTLGLGSILMVENFDFSAGASSLNLCNSTNSNILAIFRNCKLPASWSGSVCSSTPGVGSIFRLENCDTASGTNYRLEIKTGNGTLLSETTLIKTGGASDESQGISWKMTSLANRQFPFDPFNSDEIVKRNTTTGSAITVTVDILHDSVTNLTDAEVWLEVSYLGNSGVPLGIPITDAAGYTTSYPFGDPLASASDQTASSATWTTTGMTNPNKQKLSVTFTPQVVGYIHAKVKLAKSSYTIYVDPELQIS